MSFLSNQAPQVTPAILMEWLKVEYAAPEYNTLPASGTLKDIVILKGVGPSGNPTKTYYQYDPLKTPKWTNLGPVGSFQFGPLATGQGPLQLHDSDGNTQANLFVVSLPINEAQPYGDKNPLIVTDQGFVVKKDIAAGGNILSLQGSIIFGHGWTGSGTYPNNIIAQSPPLIDLLHSSESVKSGSSLPSTSSMVKQAGQIFFNTSNNTLYIWNGTNNWVVSQTNPAGGSVPKYDTLFLVKGDGYSPAHMSLGKLIAHDSVYLRVAGAAGGQLMIENINASGGVLSMGVGDSGMYPYRAWIGCPYGTNGINDFAYGMFLGFPGQSTTLLSAKWANSEKMLLNQSGALTLAGSLTVNGLITTPTGVDLTLDSGGGIWANNDFTFKGQIFMRRTSNGVIGVYDANGTNERFSLGFNTIAVPPKPSNATYLHNRLVNGLCLISDFGSIYLTPMDQNAQVIVSGGHSLNPQYTGGSGTIGNSTYYWLEMYGNTVYSANVLPRASSNSGSVGTASRYWSEMRANKYYGKSDQIGIFDMVDDLKIVSEFEAETVTVKCPKTGQDIERLVVSKESLKKIPGLVDEDDFYDHGSAVGFTFSCLNRLVKRVQSLEAEAKRVESLEAEVQKLKAQLSVKEEKPQKPEGAA